MSKIEFLNLGKQPITNNFLNNAKTKNEFFYNLKITFDEKSKIVSLSNFVPPEKMFNETYAHRASMSKTMQISNYQLSNDIKKKFAPKSILEIGSNDGIFLKNFDNILRIGVEPCRNLALITNEMRIKTYADFWDIKLAKKIINKHNRFEFIYSANTISHIHNLKETLSAIEMSLSDNGIFVIEDPSLLEVLKKISYDQFYDEHAYVFSVLAISNLLLETELEIFDIQKLSTHGGSQRIYIKKKRNKINISRRVNKAIKSELDFGMHKYETYNKFAKKVESSKKNLINIFDSLKKNKKKIIGYGATYKSATVLNYCGINTKYIDYFIDTTETKQGKYTPGTHIPIIKPSEVLDSSVDYAFLGAWNFKKEIFNKEKKFIRRGGRFITHVPTPRII
jgi:methylation protein EvaC